VHSGRSLTAIIISLYKAQNQLGLSWKPACGKPRTWLKPPINYGKKFARKTYSIGKVFISNDQTNIMQPFYFLILSARFYKKYLCNGAIISPSELNNDAEEFAKTRFKLYNEGEARHLPKSIDHMHYLYFKTKESIPVLLQQFCDIKKEIFQINLQMLMSASSTPPPKLELSAAMDRLAISSGSPSSDPFDSLRTINAIEEAERINNM